jgi:hypothetical protein
MTATAIADGVASRNFDDVRGARIAGTIPIRQHLINEALNTGLQQRRGRIQQIDVRIATGNRIELGMRVAVGPFAKWLRPMFLTELRAIPGRGPELTLTVASPEYASLMWLVQAFAGQMFPVGMRVDGRRVTVDVAAMPQAAPYRMLLQNLKSCEVATGPGVLAIAFDLRID